MKKFLAFFMTTIIAITMTTSLFTVQADESDGQVQGTIVSETIEYLPDGSSVLITVIDETPIVPYASTFTKSGSKVYSGLNSDGVVMWQFTVNGTFTVNSGINAVCTAASHTVNILENAWQNKSASSYRSENKAIGDATFIKKILFITVETKSCHVVLTCDSNGNLS